ncbi:DUF3043 domain-containing protein, partial [Agrobacterium sp. S2]|nr:DUF3043 domain-containing protein [Agrobacterium sp. S2]
WPTCCSRRGTRTSRSSVSSVLYLFIIAMVVDVAIMWRRLRKRLVAKFGQDTIQRGMMIVQRDPRLPDPPRPAAEAAGQAR